MATSGAGIAVGCTTCAVELLLDAVDEDEVRAGLAAFFDAHDGCSVFVDLARASVPLPRRPPR